MKRSSYHVRMPPNTAPTGPIDDVALTDLAITKISDSMSIPPDEVVQSPLDLSDTTDRVDIAWRIGQVLGTKTHLVQLLANKLGSKTDIPGVVSAIREVYPS